jgi:hypothetical protein
MNAKSQKANWPLGLVGAVAGGILGYFLFFVLVHHRLYALILPGAAVGLGGGLLLRGKSNLFGALCGVSGLFLGIFTDWGFEQFEDDPSFVYFLTHLHKLDAITLIMIAVGGLIAFWMGKGSDRGVQRTDE